MYTHTHIYIYIYICVCLHTHTYLHAESTATESMECQKPVTLCAHPHNQYSIRTMPKSKARIAPCSPNGPKPLKPHNTPKPFAPTPRSRKPPEPLTPKALKPTGRIHGDG